MVPDVDGLRREYFESFHAQEGGHMRFDQTYERMRSMVFWPGMWNDCMEWCKACKTCQEFTKVEGTGGASSREIASACVESGSWQSILRAPFPRRRKGTLTSCSWLMRRMDG